MQIARKSSVRRASSVAASQVCPLSPGPDHSIDDLLARRRSESDGLDRIYGFVRGVVMSTIVIHRGEGVLVLSVSFPGE